MLRIASWNVGPRSPRSILRSLRGIEPAKTADVVALSEASHPLLVALLRARHPRHRVYCYRSDVVALVPRRKPRPRVEVISHDVAWTGPHQGRPKRGRRWLLLVWDDEALLLIHRVTPRGNWRAWEAERQLIRKVSMRWDLPLRFAVVGDHNQRDHAKLAQEYDPFGLRLLPVNAAVDMCAVRRFKGEGKRLGNHGSDHVAILWELQ